MEVALSGNSPLCVSFKVLWMKPYGLVIHTKPLRMGFHLLPFKCVLLVPE